MVEGCAPLSPASNAAMVLLPTPDSCARPYWEKPRSSLSSRSLSGFLDAVLIFILSPIRGGRTFFSPRALRFHFASPYGARLPIWPHGRAKSCENDEKLCCLRSYSSSIWASVGVVLVSTSPKSHEAPPIRSTRDCAKKPWRCPNRGLTRPLRATVGTFWPPNTGRIHARSSARTPFRTVSSASTLAIHAA